MGHPEPPSGRQYQLRLVVRRATVVEVGGALRSYAVDGVDMLDGYGPDERCTAGRGQSLIPWPNRLAGGRFGFGGEDHQLALTEPERRPRAAGVLQTGEGLIVLQPGETFSDSWGITP